MAGSYRPHRPETTRHVGSGELAVGEHHLADDDHVAVGERRLGHPAAVDVGAVRRAVVEDPQLARAVDDDRVAPRDGLVVEAQLRAPPASDVRDARRQAEQPRLVAILDDEVATGLRPRAGDRALACAGTEAGESIESAAVGVSVSVAEGAAVGGMRAGLRARLSDS
jgi:hypothetical protein